MSTFNDTDAALRDEAGLIPVDLGVVEAIRRETLTTGTVFYVHSGTGSNGNSGLSQSEPLATIDYAIGLCTASKGDVIVVMPGHSETLTAKITADIAGIKIKGLGAGTLRPQLTVGGTIDGIDVTAANVTIDGLYFNEATAAATSNINIAAANCTIRRVHMDAGANDVDTITITGNGELPTIEDCTVILTANGPDSWVKFEGVVDRPIIRNNVIIGSDGTNAYDDGVFDFNSQAVTNPAIYGNVFNGAGVSTTVVANGSSVTGAVYGPNSYGGSAVDADNVSGGAANLSAITDQLSGTTGIASWPAGAAPGNGVSIAEALRAIYDAQQGTVGIAAFPAAAAPANDVSMAEVLRDIWDVLRNGTGGTEPGTNRSILNEIRGSALNYNAVNYLAVPVDFTSATWNTAATHEVLTVTGLVRLRILIEGTGDVDSAAHGATVAFGDEVAQTWIAATDETEIDNGDLWYDNTPTASQDTFANAILDRIVNGLDIGYVIANEALTTGSITVHCWWEPLNATGAVVAGAGGVLA